MRIFFFLNLAVFAAAFQIYAIRSTWEDWKSNHGKNYSGLEDQFRSQIFYENLAMINSHNERANRGEETYFLGLNDMSDKLAQEVKAIRNGLSMAKYRRYSGLITATFVPPENLVVPASIDWREKGAVTPVKNQGYCGSCWAFSATGALEGQHFRKTGKLVSLSEQNLMDCSWDYGNDGCDGGFMNQAFMYVRDNHGIDTEESYPYEMADDDCQFNKNTIGADSTGFVNIRQSRDDDLMKAIASVGPIAVGIDASTPMFTQYTNGIYNRKGCSPKNLDHGVLVVGYGSESGHDYWILKNSWGESWGEKGYFRMSRNTTNMCGISQLASFPLV